MSSHRSLPYSSNNDSEAQLLFNPTSESKPPELIYDVGDRYQRYGAIQVSQVQVPEQKPFSLFFSSDKTNSAIVDEPRGTQKTGNGQNHISVILSKYTRHTFFDDQHLTVGIYGSSIGIPCHLGVCTMGGMAFYPTKIGCLPGFAVGGIACVSATAGGLLFAVCVSVTAEIVMRIKLNRIDSLEELFKALNTLDQQGFPQGLKDTSSPHSLRDPVFIKGRHSPVSARMLYKHFREGGYTLDTIKLIPKNVVTPEHYSKKQKDIVGKLQECFELFDTLVHLKTDQKVAYSESDISLIEKQLNKLIKEYESLIRAGQTG